MPANQASAGHLLQLIRSGQATTRGELQLATGLSRSTVGHRLDQLFDAGWLSNTTGTSTGGRPSVRLEFDSTHAVVLAVDLETRHGRAAVIDLSGRILAEHTAQLLIADGPDLVLDTVASWFPDLLARAAVDGECGVRDRAVGTRSGRLGHRAGRAAPDHAGLGRVPDPVTDAGGVRPAGEFGGGTRPGPRRQRRQPHGVRRAAPPLPGLLGVRPRQGLHRYRCRSRRRR